MPEDIKLVIVKQLNKQQNIPLKMFKHKELKKMSQVLKRVTRKSDSFEAKNKERKGGSSLLHSTINMKKTPKQPHILIYFIVHF